MGLVFASEGELARAFSRWGRNLSIGDYTRLALFHMSLWGDEYGMSCTDIIPPGFEVDCDEPQMCVPTVDEHVDSSSFELAEVVDEEPMPKEIFRGTWNSNKRPGNVIGFKCLEQDVKECHEHTLTEHFTRFNYTHCQEVNMDRIVDPNAKSFIPVDIGKSYLNETIAYFQTIFGHLPKEYYAIDFDDRRKVLDLKKSMEEIESHFKVQNKFIFKSPDRKTGKTVICEVNYILDGGVLLFLTTVFNAAIAVYDDGDQLEELLKHIVSKKLRKRKEKPKFQLLVHTNYGFSTEEFELKSFNVDVSSNYNDDLPDAKIRHFIESDGEAGLCILHGKPGTGKTYYIRDLIKSSKRDFIYLSKECLNYISDAAFIAFLTKHKNCVFIMEDCESVLVDRSQYNNTISTLLNLSDGLLGDSLNNKFLCTFNTDIANIDEALLRKGRMKVCYEFGYLPPEKANVLADRLNKIERFDKPVPLCEIMNSESNGNEDIPSKKHKQIGF